MNIPDKTIPAVVAIVLYFAWIFAVWGTTVYLVVERDWSPWWFLFALLLTALN